MPRSLRIPLIVIMSLFGNTIMAQERYSFVFTDVDGVPLEDVVVEPVQTTGQTKSNEVAVIYQVDKRFKPTQILITQGQAVDFPNSDNIRHHVYSFSKAKTFELKLYADKPEQPLNFSEHGVVVLGCNIHDTMIGYIFISSSSDSVMSDKHGHAVMTTPDGVTDVNVWHRHQASGPETLQTLSLNDLPKNNNGDYMVEIATLPPEPTNSFEDTFSGLSSSN